MARLGIIGSRNLSDPAWVGEVLGKRRSDDEALVVVASEGGVGEQALHWAVEAGVGYETVPAEKVAAVADEVIALAEAGDEEMDSLVRRAQSLGKPVEVVRYEGKAAGNEQRRESSPVAGRRGSAPADVSRTGDAL